VDYYTRGGWRYPDAPRTFAEGLLIEYRRGSKQWIVLHKAGLDWNRISLQEWITDYGSYASREDIRVYPHVAQYRIADELGTLYQTHLYPDEVITWLQ
jgi:hypothetical protein